MLFKKTPIIFLLLASISCLAEKPRVSIITSVFKGDPFIREFLIDITQQTIFDQCELIMINANSPHNEEPIILEYAARYPNIKYLRLEQDPGLYPVWNIGIKLAQADYITNANLDDRLAFNCYEIHAKTLDEHPNIDLVYSDNYASTTPNLTFNMARERKTPAWIFPQFSVRIIADHCVPHNHPMWRKSMHDKAGYFAENYKSAADYEMWLRATEAGSVFLKVNQILAVFYINRSGLSKQDGHKAEVREIKEKYKHLKNR